MSPIPQLPPSDAAAVAARAPSSGLTPDGRFRFDTLLARGRLGEVFAASAVQSGAGCVVRVLDRPAYSAPSLGPRIVEDAVAAEGIVDLHVAAVLGAGLTAKGLPWVAMERLDGMTLAQRVAMPTEDPLTTAERWRLLLQVTLGLSALHDAGVAHGDLRPSNVFLSRLPSGGWRVKLVDHCLSRRVEADRARSAADPSAEWVAPECGADAPIAPSADLWSLGLLAYWLFTERSYWPGGRVRLDVPLPSASERAARQGLAGRLPADFDGWFDQCVARAPRDRFPSAREASIAWHALFQQAPEGADDRAEVPAVMLSEGSVAPGTAPLAEPPPLAPFAASRASLAPAGRASLAPASRASLPPGTPTPLRQPTRPPPMLRGPVDPPDRSTTTGRWSTRPPTGRHEAFLDRTERERQSRLDSGSTGQHPAVRSNTTGQHPAVRSNTTGQHPAVRSNTTGPHVAVSPGETIDAPPRVEESPGATVKASEPPSRYTVPLVAARRISTMAPRPTLRRTLTVAAAAATAMLVTALLVLSRKPSTPTEARSPGRDAPPARVVASAPSAAAPHTVEVTPQPPAPTPQSEPAPALPAAAASPPPTSPTAMSDWPINAIRVWSGRLRGRGASCAFTVALRRRSPIAVAGFFIWRVRDPQQPGATIEVRENLRGAMDPSQTLVRLRGVQSSDPLRMPVGSYALHLRRDGVLTGSTITPGTRLEGSYDPAAAARVSAHLIPEARAVRPATTGSRPLPRR